MKLPKISYKTKIPELNQISEKLYEKQNVQ